MAPVATNETQAPVTNNGPVKAVKKAAEPLFNPFYSPTVASDKDDSRQVSVVEALKLESETLKDLDHPNIVQYLGFEETPRFLSMYVYFGLGL